MNDRPAAQWADDSGCLAPETQRAIWQASKVLAEREATIRTLRTQLAERAPWTSDYSTP